MSITALKRGALLLIPTAALLLLSSCIDVNENVTLNADGSGVVKVAYRVSRLVVDLPKSAGTEFTLILPPDPAQFRSSVGAAGGLTLQSFTPIEDPQSVGADASIAFARLSDLNSLLEGRTGDGFALTQSAGRTTFKQTIYAGTNAGAEQQTLDLAKKLFRDYKLAFTLSTPSPIQSANLGTVSSDKTTVTYTTTIPDIIQSTTPVVWEVSW